MTPKPPRIPVFEIVQALHTTSHNAPSGSRCSELDVVVCPDNAHIPRHFKAGRIKNGVQFMHNGLKINFGSYYGLEIARLLYENLGVHEPQEEYIFGQVLTHLPTNAIIVELGAYWGFYSMWLLSVLPQAKAYLVEPDAENLKSGQTSKAIKVNEIYPYCYARAVTENDTVRFIPIDFIGEKLKKHGKLNMEIYIDTTLKGKRRLNIKTEKNYN